MLKTVEQKQARDPWGTPEQYEAAMKKGEPIPDTPPYFYYEKEKKQLQRKIKNAKNELKMLKSCSAKK